MAKKPLIYASIAITASVLMCAAGTITAVENTGLSEKLAGRILLQVESKGEAWYVDPVTFKRRFLSRPADAFSLMRELAMGIADDDIKKIPIGLVDYDDSDNDGDGLKNRLETAFGTDPEKTDTDGDGFNDYEEIFNGYDPLADGKTAINESFTKNHAGKILLQTEKNGEAWYVDPASLKRYYLGRPADAFKIMRELGLGITNENIALIPIALEQTEPADSPWEPPVCSNCQNSGSASAILGAAAAFKSNSAEEAKKYFIEDVRRAVEYMFEYQSKESLQTIGDLLSNAYLIESNESEAVYNVDAYISLMDANATLTFKAIVGDDDIWRLTGL